MYASLPNYRPKDTEKLKITQGKWKIKEKN